MPKSKKGTAIAHRVSLPPALGSSDRMHCSAQASLRAAGPSLMLAIPAQANGVCGEAVSHSALLFNTAGCKVGGAAQAALAICLHRSHRILSDPLGSSLLLQL